MSPGGPKDARQKVLCATFCTFLVFVNSLRPSEEPPFPPPNKKRRTAATLRRNKACKAGGVFLECSICSMEGSIIVIPRFFIHMFWFQLPSQSEGQNKDAYHRRLEKDGGGRGLQVEILPALLQGQVPMWALGGEPWNSKINPRNPRKTVDPQFSCCAVKFTLKSYEGLLV